MKSAEDELGEKAEMKEGMGKATKRTRNTYKKVAEAAKDCEA